jgi:hypothetical protein
MIDKNGPVVIERVGNGYQVRPMCDRNSAVCLSDVMVFQDKGLASSMRDNQAAESTLLGWLDAHFADAVTVKRL